MKIVQIIKKKIGELKQKEVEHQSKYLEVYYTRLFMATDTGKLEIPAFLKAKSEVERLKRNGLLSITYKQIKEGVQ